MPAAISDSELKLIVEMIRNWPKTEKFKWENVCVGAQSILGYIPTRQALDKKTSVKTAYLAKKNQLRTETEILGNVRRPRSITDAIERLAKLEQENRQLKAELQKMADIANRFIYNASTKGISRDQLMKPIPSKK